MEALESGLAHVEQGIQTLVTSQESAATDMREIRKLYHTEFAGRLQAMQSELDRYHEQDQGRLYDDILGRLAKVYNDHEPILGDITDPTLTKRVRFLFMDMADLLAEHGVGLHKSQPGDKRNPRYCQVIERVPTTDEALQDTVVRSRGTGFFIDNRPLVKELVDVYIYTAPNAPAAEL